MTYKQQTELLMQAVQLLMKLYKDISARGEPFTLLRGSELKKISTIRF